jgi:hypothetical protein
MHPGHYVGYKCIQRCGRWISSTHVAVQHASQQVGTDIDVAGGLASSSAITAPDDACLPPEQENHVSAFQWICQATTGPTVSPAGSHVCPLGIGSSFLSIHILLLWRMQVIYKEKHGDVLNAGDRTLFFMKLPFSFRRVLHLCWFDTSILGFLDTFRYIGSLFWSVSSSL